jgi:hypothetical protein
MLMRTYYETQDKAAYFIREQLDGEAEAYEPLDHPVG